MQKSVLAVTVAFLVSLSLPIGAQEAANLGFDYTAPADLPFKSGPPGRPRQADRLVSGKLPNGLRYVIAARRGEPVVVRLNVAVGWKAEAESENDSAHLIEHRAFVDTKNFPSGGFLKLSQWGGLAHIGNTGDYSTRYGFSVPNSTSLDAQEAIAIVRDWADGINLSDDAINRERGVMVSEARSTSKAEAEAHLIRHLIAERLTGSDTASRQQRKEVAIRNVSPDIVRAFYKRWYRPSLMTVSVVGDLDMDVWEAALKAGLSALKNPPEKVPELKRPSSMFPSVQRVFVLPSSEAKDVEVTTYIVRPPIPVHGSVAVARRQILTSLGNNILVNRSNSFPGPQDSVWAGQPSIGYFSNPKVDGIQVTTIGFDLDYIQRMKLQQHFILQIRSYPVTKDEFRRALNYVAMNDIAASADSSATIASFYADNEGRVDKENYYVDRAERRRILSSISLEEVRAHMARLASGEMQTAVIAPIAEAPSIETELLELELASALSASVPPPRTASVPHVGVSQVGEFDASNDASPIVSFSRVRMDSFLLPGGRSLIVTAPAKNDYANSISLSAIGSLPGLQRGVDEAEKFSVPVVFSPKPTERDGYQAYLEDASIRAMFTLSENSAILNIDAAPGAEAALFHLLHQSLSYPGGIRLAGAAINEPWGARVDEALKAWDPSLFIFSGAANPSDISAIASESLAAFASQDQVPKCTFDTNKTIGRLQGSKLKFELGGAKIDSACLAILNNVMGRALLGEMRYRRSINYATSLQMRIVSAKDAEGIQELIFYFGSPDIAEAQSSFNEGLLALIASFGRGDIERDTFEIQQRVLVRERLSVHASPSDAAAELARIFISRNRSSRAVEAYRMNKVEYGDFVQMTRSLFSKIER